MHKIQETISKDEIISLERKEIIESKQEEILKIGDKMKIYESMTTKQRFDRKDIVVVRLDGKGFSAFTKSLRSNDIFHKGFNEAMKELTKYLFKYNPIVGYTQSDEVTLIFINNEKSYHPFGGRIFKILSLLAADASLKFTSLIPQYIPERIGYLASFDCRAFTVPSIDEAYNCILWRHKDGYRNAVSTVARNYFSSKEIYNKNRKQQLKMLEAKNIFFHENDDHNKNGSLFIRKLCKIILTNKEIDLLPEKHNARKNPSVEFERHIVTQIKFEDFTRDTITGSNN